MSAPNGAIAVAVADAVAGMDAVGSVVPKVVRKAVETLVRVAADAVVEANVLTMRQQQTPTPRARPVPRGPTVVVSGRNEVMRALKPAETLPPRAATVVAVVAEAAAESARNVTRAPRRPATRWQPMSCHWPQRPLSIRKPTWPRRVPMRPKAPRPVRADAVVAAAAVADAIAIRCVQNRPTVSQVPRPTPWRPQTPRHRWPMATSRCRSLLATQPMAVSVMAAVAAAEGATAATAVTAKNPAPMGNPSAVVSLQRSRWRVRLPRRH